jgi:elongation factor G
MKVAEERKIPRMLIVTKIDEAPEGQLEDLVGQLQKAFGAICLPINLPSLKGKKVINVFEHAGNDDAGNQPDFSSVRGAHKAIVEQVIELDEDLTMQYLEKGEGFDPDKLHEAFEQCLDEGHLVPICFCSAKTGVGIDDLLHIFASLCPSPDEVHPSEFLRRDPEGKEHDYRPDPIANGPVIAHIFKVTTDPFVGKLGFFRVHEGILKSKADLLVDDNKKPVRLAHLHRFQGKDHEELQEVGPGMIAAVAKVDELRFNAVLHDSHEFDNVRVKPLPLSTFSNHSWRPLNCPGSPAFSARSRRSARPSRPASKSRPLPLSKLA